MTQVVDSSKPDTAKTKQALVAHTCNSSYSGGKDKEDAV
jgi:hypothetical protein